LSGRLSYEESCARLRELQLLGPDEFPPLPTRMPAHDDEEPLGVNFFRTALEDVDLSGLTLPRTFLGRSELRGVRFDNTDLSESNLCWNDLVSVVFDSADLSRADLRASSFFRVSFRGADLRGADFRRSSFEYCIFTDAAMDGALAPRDPQFILSPAQAAAVTWIDDEGPEPDGG